MKKLTAIHPVANSTDFIQSVIKEFAITDMEVRSFTPQELQKIYKEAYAAYEKKKYRNAEILFKQLIFCDPFDERFWKGYGGALQMQQKYLEALHAWAALATLEIDDPMPHLHATECYLFLENKEDARKAFALAVEKMPPSSLNIQFEKLKSVLDDDS